MSAISEVEMDKKVTLAPRAISSSKTVAIPKKS